jgi:hypothetical protein
MILKTKFANLLFQRSLAGLEIPSKDHKVPNPSIPSFEISNHKKLPT